MGNEERLKPMEVVSYIHLNGITELKVQIRGRGLAKGPDIKLEIVAKANRTSSYPEVDLLIAICCVQL